MGTNYRGDRAYGSWRAPALAVFFAGPHGRSISGQVLPIYGDSKSTS